VAGLGGRAHLFAIIGDDPLGEVLRKTLEDHGVTTHLAVKPVPTGRSINLSWKSGHRHFLSSLLNNRLMQAGDILDGFDQQQDVGALLRADIWFSESMLYEGNLVLFERARARGIDTYLDINWDPMWATGPAKQIKERKSCTRRLLPLVQYVHGNLSELAEFTGYRAFGDVCRSLLDDGCEEVVIHNGKCGAISIRRGEPAVEAPATPISKVICPTGCGDVFCAVHMLLSKLPAAERLQQACAVAAAHLSGQLALLPRLA
jgi:sugar/nucleoside kinase (ribokinase family)